MEKAGIGKAVWLLYKCNWNRLSLDLFGFGVCNHVRNEIRETDVDGWGWRMVDPMMHAVVRQEEKSWSVTMVGSMHSQVFPLLARIGRLRT